MATIRLNKTALEYLAGSAATPASTASYSVENLTLMPRTKENIGARSNVGAYQPSHDLVGAVWHELSFDMQLYGQRASAENPYVGRLLEACGCSVAGTTAFTYALGDLHTDGDTPDGVTEPVSLTVNNDGLEYISANCVGSFGINFEAGQIPMWNFNFIGANSVLAATAGAETAQTSFATPVYPVRAAAGSFTIGGTSVVCRSCSYAVNNVLAARPDLNGVEGRAIPVISRRNPGGSCVIEVTALSTFNPETLAFAASKTSQAFTYTHNDGGTVFDEVAFTWTAYIRDVTLLFDANGIQCWQLDFTQDFSTGPFTAAWSDN